MTLAVVLADTHLHAASTRGLPQQVFDALAHADIVLHAGDVVDGTVLTDLARFAPVYAVLGNNDIGLEGTLPETRIVDLDGVRVGMIHDSGTRAGRDRRMRRRFPDADVVVFGHSHIPWNAPGIDGQLLFNPGSPTQRRRQPEATFGLLECRQGRVVKRQIVPIARTAATSGTRSKR